MSGPSQVSPVTGTSLSNQSLPPVLLDSSVRNLTGQLEEMDSKPFAWGGYSSVYKYRAHNSSTGLRPGDVFAVKSLSMRFYTGDNQKGLAKLKREIEVWVSLNHRNVLKLLGVLYRDGIPFPSLVSDFMGNGTASDYLRHKPEANIISLIRDISKGLSYMHRKGVAHGDIKGDNVLIARDGCARIGDFGLSRTLGHDGSAMDLSTTDGNRANRWTAMEYLDFTPGAPQGPTRAGDVWSFGCTILQLFSGKLPYYDAINDAEVAIRLAPPKQQLPSFPPGLLRSDFEKFRKGITAFCHLCWIKDPVHRPTMFTLESIICSYCSATCGDPRELSEASHDIADTPREESHEDLYQISKNDIAASGGPRSRSSSQPMVTPDSNLDQFSGLPEPLVAEPEGSAAPGRLMQRKLLENLPSSIQVVSMMFEEVTLDLVKMAETRGVDETRITQYRETWTTYVQEFDQIMMSMRDITTKGADYIKDFIMTYCGVLFDETVHVSTKIEKLEGFTQKLLVVFGEDAKDLSGFVTRVIALKRNVEAFGTKPGDNVRFAGLDSSVTSSGVSKLTDLEIQPSYKKGLHVMWGKWSSITDGCCEKIISIKNQLQGIHHVWQALRADSQALLIQLKVIAEDEEAQIFNQGLGTLQMQYMKVYDEFYSFTHNESIAHRSPQPQPHAQKAWFGQLGGFFFQPST